MWLLHGRAFWYRVILVYIPWHTNVGHENNLLSLSQKVKIDQINQLGLN